MKARLCLSFLILAAMLSVASAQPVPTESTVPITEDLQAIAKKGDRLRLQAITALMDDAKEVTVLGFGPGAWVLVEYERTYLKPGESGLKKERSEMWVNFNHVIAAKRIEAAK